METFDRGSSTDTKAARRQDRIRYFPLSTLYEGRTDIPSDLAPHYHVVVDSPEELQRAQAAQPDFGVVKYTIRDDSFDQSLY